MQNSTYSTLIVCSTSRLARSLEQEYTKSQLNQNLDSWQPLNIKTLEAWLDGLLNIALLTGEIDAGQSPTKCLSSIEERLIWQAVISAKLNNNPLKYLFDLTGLANACIEANRYMVAWRLNVLTENSTEETRQFLNWQQLFRKRCHSLNVLEKVRYFDWQIDCLTQGAGTLPDTIAFAGFDQSAPQEQRLRDLLVDRGCQVSSYPMGQGFHAAVKQTLLEDESQEIRAMIAWAKERLETHPTTKIAIVVPSLSELRNRLADLLDDVFDPALLRPSLFESPRIYNFSLGVPLVQQKVIETALNLIRLFSNQELDQADISAILLSPYWSASQQEADSRALLDAAMREQLQQSVEWNRLLKFMQAQTQLNIQSLIEDTLAGFNLIQQQARKQSASAWMLVFSQLLQHLKWPGARGTSSYEYQAMQAWGKVLQQFSALDFLGEQLSANAASSLLLQIAKEHIFQPETTGQSPIQVLGIMEALSSPVDAMWVMGMNDDDWPLPARPNPLLPANIQRAAKVANADSAIQLVFAQKIHQRLLDSAKTIIFSSSLKSGDKALRPSPLIQNIPISAETLPIAKTFAESQAALGNADITLIDDHLAPAVSDSAHVRGGTGLLRAQAICPAWAFYQYRLGAKSLKTPKSGLDAAERGQLVHAVLEAFWQARDWSDLHAMQDEALQLAVSKAVTSAVEIFTQHHDEVFSSAILTLEHERLTKLVLAWLAFEKSRAVIFQMVACEAEKKVNIGGIEVTLKIDRVHRLENGGLELVDYKTGRLPSIKSWGEDRITEPQLPIYAVFYDEAQNIASIQFGLVKTAEHVFTGISEANFEADADKRKPEFIRNFTDWSHLKAHWKSSIEVIVQEVKAGEAAIRFANDADLLYCEVLPLLRLPERQLQFERQLLADAKPVEIRHD